MREIEFRAWINGGESEDFNHIMTYDLAFEKFAPVNELLNDVNKWGALMQYTGLKDKNGVKIFEGDIVLLSKWDSEFIVSWDDFGFVYKGIQDGHEDVDLWQTKHVLVIGNKFENPELLEA